MTCTTPTPASPYDAITVVTNKYDRHSSGLLQNKVGWTSPRFIGRAVVALARDTKVMEKSGKVLIAAALGREYRFTDIDGKTPKPLAPEDL